MLLRGKFEMKILQATIGFLGLAIIISTNVIAGEIHRAAYVGNIEKVKLLLKKNPNLINQKDESSDMKGYTPLLESLIPYYPLLDPSKDLKQLEKREAWPKKMEVAKFLIENGADVTVIAPSGGKTALHLAAEYGEKEIAELLIAKGADVNAKTGEKGVASNGVSEAPLRLCFPKHVAFPNGTEEGRRRVLEEEGQNDRHFSVAKLLIEKGANVNEVEGGSSLLQRCSCDDVKFAALLLDAGAKFDLPDVQWARHCPSEKDNTISGECKASPLLGLFCEHGAGELYGGYICAPPISCHFR